MKNVGFFFFFFRIPISVLGGVHPFPEIAHSHKACAAPIYYSHCTVLYVRHFHQDAAYSTVLSMKHDRAWPSG